MKSKVLNRKMFRKGMDIENVGIMDGFKDSMHESLMEALSKNGMPEEDDDALEREDDDARRQNVEETSCRPRCGQDVAQHVAALHEPQTAPRADDSGCARGTFHPTDPSAAPASTIVPLPPRLVS